MLSASASADSPSPSAAGLRSLAPPASVERRSSPPRLVWRAPAGEPGPSSGPRGALCPLLPALLPSCAVSVAAASPSWESAVLLSWTSSTTSFVSSASSSESGSRRAFFLEAGDCSPSSVASGDLRLGLRAGHRSLVTCWSLAVLECHFCHRMHDQWEASGSDAVFSWNFCQPPCRRRKQECQG